MLLAAGVYAVHQLRFLVGYGPNAHAQLAAQGHAYMTLLAPLLALALVLVLAEFAARLARAAPGPAGRAPRLAPLWAFSVVALLVAYSAQETLEGLLTSGHPGSVAGLVGHGGWTALPFAAAVALVIALLTRGARCALELAAEPRPAIRAPRTSFRISPSAAPQTPPRRAPALGGTAARAPPLVSPA